MQYIQPVNFTFQFLPCFCVDIQILFSEFGRNSNYIIFVVFHFENEDRNENKINAEDISNYAMHNNGQ